MTRLFSLSNYFFVLFISFKNIFTAVFVNSGTIAWCIIEEDSSERQGFLETELHAPTDAMGNKGTF